MKKDEVIVSFRGVRKTYDGETLVVKGLDLDIYQGEFLTLLGPSGSGKTTCLMMLAGFEFPTGGEIRLDGQLLNTVPPHKRNIGMVFQNYALFPHLTVAQNVEYPLTVRKLGTAERAARVHDALRMVRMEGFAKRYPAQLSGGQQQRIALARALVFEPRLVLMDEPLGALDKQLREHMQLELKALHEKLGLTFVYVTHDQGEALTMSDRVAVFDKGIVQQLDTVDRLYESPCNEFVANFIGDSNTLHGMIDGVDGEFCQLRLRDGTHVVGRNIANARAGDRLHPARAAAARRAGQRREHPSGRQRAGKRCARAHLFRRPRAHALRGAATGRVFRQSAARHRGARYVCARRADRARVRTRTPARFRLIRTKPRFRASCNCSVAAPADLSTKRRTQMKTKIIPTHRTAVTLAVAAAATLSFAAGTHAAELTVVNFGGANADAQKIAYYQPFEKQSGDKVTAVEYNGETAKIKAMVEAKHVNWDVVEVESGDLGRGCDEGLYEKLDWSKIAKKDELIAESPRTCGVGFFVWSTALAYNADKLKTAPTGWADFWNVKKFPGKRALRKGARGNLEFALMADGVAPREVYKVLATKAGQDRAFKKLDELKPNIQWWEAGAQPPQFLVAGDVVMSSAFNGRISAAQSEGKNLKVVWSGSIYDLDYWVIPKGSPNKALAEKFIAYTVSSDPQKIYAQHITYGPANRGAIKGLDAKTLANLPNSPANGKNAVLQDAAFWTDYGDELEQRFAAWASK